MASKMSAPRAQAPVTCSLCDGEGKVHWYCNNCQDYLCEKCKGFHKRGKKTRNHDVVPVSDAKRDADRPVPDVCKQHPGNLCNMYCSDCSTLICSACLSQIHKKHSWKLLEDELTTKQKDLQRHMTNISDKITHFRNVAATRHQANKDFKESIDTMRTDVQVRRTKLKQEVDYIADVVLADLSLLESEEDDKHNRDSRSTENHVVELRKLFEKAETARGTSASLFEKEKSLRTYIPLYDVNATGVLPTKPNFTPGRIDSALLRDMMGTIHMEKMNKMVKVDSTNVLRLSQFTVKQQDQIVDICPVDDDHAWLVIHQYKRLVLVNREGVVKESVELDFCPHRIAMVRGKTDRILMTHFASSAFVHQLSVHNHQVTTFADISPHEPYSISTNEGGEVFVSTGTPAIVVLNQLGETINTVTCEFKVRHIVCLTSGEIAVTVEALDTLCKDVLIVDQTGKTRNKWSGELDNGHHLGEMRLFKMSSDRYDRLFVPDYTNNQVYVLSRDSKQATRLLDKKHGVVDITAVGVASCGDVWIGCIDGSVHVMRL